MNDPGFKPRAPAVIRAAAILDLLVDASGAPVGVNELARSLGVAKSSISNICAALESIDALTRDDSGYRLGRRLAEWGGAYLDSQDYLGRFKETVPTLPVIGSETVQIAVLAGLEVVYIARSDGTHQVRLASAIGRKLPATSTATGKALLALLDEDELDRRLGSLDVLPQATDHAKGSVAELRAELEQVRIQHYAVDDEEMAIGVQCVAIAVDMARPNDDPIAISCTYMASRSDPAFVRSVIEDLNELGKRVADPFETRRLRGEDDST